MNNDLMDFKDLKVGDIIKFQFGNSLYQGKVVKLFNNKMVYIKVYMLSRWIPFFSLYDVVDFDDRFFWKI